MARTATTTVRHGLGALDSIPRKVAEHFDAVEHGHDAVTLEQLRAASADRTNMLDEAPCGRGFSALSAPRPEWSHFQFSNRFLSSNMVLVRFAAILEVPGHLAAEVRLEQHRDGQCMPGVPILYQAHHDRLHHHIRARRPG